MWFWMSSAQVALKRDKLRLAESKLLEIAQRFGAKQRQQPRQQLDATTAAAAAALTSSGCHLEVFDTHISRSSVPCLHSTAHSAADNDYSNEFVIHGIQVTAERNANDDTELKLKSTTPLVMLHGYMNAGAYFYRNLVGLASYFSTVYSLDMLGWGLSSRPSFPLLEEEINSVSAAEAFFVDSLEAWRAKKNIDKMILAGHSMGGYIGVAYCEKYPERVERLILLSPAGVPEESEDAKIRRQETLRVSSWSHKMTWRFYHYVFDHHTLGEIFRTMPENYGLGRMSGYVEKRIPSITEQDEREAVSSYLYLNSVLPGSGEYCVNRLLNSNVYAKNPQVYRIPQLKVDHISFLYGDHDWMDINGGLDVQRACAEKQQKGEQAPNVTVYKIRDAGHLLMLDNWQEFNAGVILSAGYTKEDLGPDAPLPMEQPVQGKVMVDDEPSTAAASVESSGPQVSPI